MTTETPDSDRPAPHRWTRRAFVATLATAGAGAATYGYGRYIEADHFEVHTVPLPRALFPAPVGLKILHLTDLHYGRDVPLTMIAEAIRLGLAQRPDLVCLTGDFVSGRLRDAEAYSATLRVLTEAAPTFACVGNHDGLPGVNPAREESHHGRVAAMLTAAGVRFLHNRRERVTVRGAEVTVAGVGDLWAKENDPLACFGPPVPPDAATPTILLNHNPDARRSLQPYPWHLMLCGHTHGGQCGLPWVAERLAPVRDKSHIEGLRERDGRLIHISRGVGNLHGVRILCRPQVSVLTVV